MQRESNSFISLSDLHTFSFHPLYTPLHEFTVKTLAHSHPARK